MFIWTSFYLQISFKLSLSCSQVTEKMSFESVHKLCKNDFYSRDCSLFERIVSEVFDKIEGWEKIRLVERFSQLLEKILELKSSHSRKLSILSCNSPFSPNKGFHSSFMSIRNNPFGCLLLNKWLETTS